ncbi:uncharacterized protein DNG_00289 [Cephalotrichum gorgonifer]|uniref:Uncharacterized protein n=1 Tax=Cephalotrichum gorgonifer TaxID=2041049 RepID=A0AAE8SQN9_9PEZI|nr:uncharacterized protein DNG_00289 [Cephalotrichum gorgonifer]
MSDKDVAQQHQENAPQKKRGCAAHCKRFWWAYLILAVVVIVLVVVLVLFVGVPKIAQKKINEAKLNIDGIIVSETEPNKYRMSVNSSITTDGSVHADIDGFVGNMYLEDLEPHTPFAALNFPATTSQKFTEVNVSQIVDVANMDAFTTFNTWLLANESLKLTIEGDTHVRVKGLSKKYGVTFKKTIELKGLNGFKGLEVTEPHVDLVALTNNFQALVKVPNASILTIEIGNATFVNKYDGEDIGTVYMDNLVLYPGINDVPMHADIKQEPVLVAITTKPHCTDGIVPFDLSGKDVKKDGETLSYYANALSQLELNVPIKLGDAFAEAGLEVSCD